MTDPGRADFFGFRVSHRAMKKRAGSAYKRTEPARFGQIGKIVVHGR